MSDQAAGTTSKSRPDIGAILAKAGNRGKLLCVFCDMKDGWRDLRLWPLFGGNCLLNMTRTPDDDVLEPSSFLLHDTLQL